VSAVPKEPQDRAEDLQKRQREDAETHEGNRVSADEDAPQPTRESTRDQQK
jgi:hypothetical protein